MQQFAFWRMTAFCGLGSAILLGTSTILGASARSNEPVAQLDAAGSFIIFLIVTLPYTLNMLFFLGLTLILMPPERSLFYFALHILNAAAYIVTLPAVALFVAYSARTPLLDQDPEWNGMIVDVLMQQANLLMGILIGSIGLALYQSRVFPRWLTYFTLAAAIPQFVMAGYWELETFPTGFIILSTTLPLWVTVVSALLLIAHQGMSERFKTQTVIRIDEPTQKL